MVNIALVDWWAAKEDVGLLSKDTRAIVLPVAWCQWTHKNDVVFNGRAPRAMDVLRKVQSEGVSWKASRLIYVSGLVDGWACSD